MKMKSLLKRKTTAMLAIAGAVFCGSQAMAQVKVGTNPGTINANAVLDVESTTKGVLFPRVALTSTTAAAPLAAHVAGMQVYNTASAGDVTPGNYYNDGSQWVRLVTEQPEATQVFGSGVPSGTCTGGTVYTDTLSTSATLGRQWTCSGGTWVAYKAPSSTPFYLWGTSNDAGANKNAWIYRNSGLVVQDATKASRVTLQPTGGLTLVRNMPTLPNYGGFVDFSNSLTEANKFRIAMRTNLGGSGIDVLAFHTSGGVPRMALTSLGRFGIGTTNPQRLLHVMGAIFGGDEVAQTGSVGLGTSNSDGYMLTYNATGSNVAVQNSSSAANLLLSKVSAATNDVYTGFYDNGAMVGSITKKAGGVGFNETSDERLKENIKTTHYSVADLMKINVMDYNYKADKNKTQVTGFVAQQLYKIFPYAVNVGGADAKTNPWTVDYSKVTPLLVKAIQDQQKEIASLKAQLSEMNALRNEVASIKALIGNADVNKATESK